MRIGLGFDAHPFADGRDLTLGGVRIEHTRGLLGHSDADVLCHAVCDAVLGAAGLGDIGSHFPDTDERYAGASSLDLLARVAVLAGQAGFRVSSVDATVLLEDPKLAPHIGQMRTNIARAAGTDLPAVSVKATRLEAMGFIGRREGAAAIAVALLTEPQPSRRRFLRRRRPRRE